MFVSWWFDLAPVWIYVGEDDRRLLRCLFFCLCHLFSVACVAWPHWPMRLAPFPILSLRIRLGTNGVDRDWVKHFLASSHLNYHFSY